MVGKWMWVTGAKATYPCSANNALTTQWTSSRAARQEGCCHPCFSSAKPHHIREIMTLRRAFCLGLHNTSQSSPSMWFGSYTPSCAGTTTLLHLGWRLHHQVHHLTPNWRASSMSGIPLHAQLIHHETCRGQLVELSTCAPSLQSTNCEQRSFSKYFATSVVQLGPRSAVCKVSMAFCIQSGALEGKTISVPKNRGWSWAAYVQVAYLVLFSPCSSVVGLVIHNWTLHIECGYHPVLVIPMFPWKCWAIQQCSLVILSVLGTVLQYNG